MTAVGIDLGTTISSVGRADESRRVILARLRDGGPRLRSVIASDGSGGLVFGDEAQRLAPIDPDNTFALFKRSMGTDWSVRSDDRTWTPSELSGELLRALVDDTEADFGERPGRAAISIPAYFGDDARRATREAGALAGLEVIALPHEPTAACIAYRPGGGERSTILVYDLGGGTFDVSVVRFDDQSAEVVATAGDDRLGGKDWDDVLVALVTDRLLDAVGADVRDDDALLADLQERARDAKHALTRMPKTAVTLQVGGGMHRVEVTRAEFEELSEALFNRTHELVARVLDDIGGAGLLDDVLLVGGSSRMPRCGEVLRRATGLTPRKGVDPDAAVTIGAAIIARDTEADRRSHGVSLSRAGIRDVTAHALGFVVVSPDGSRYVNQVMIDRNAPIPASATKRQRLTVDRKQGGVLDVFMLQGDAERPLGTNPLGRWTFDDVRGHRRGHVEVDVSYAYDIDGVVHVSAAVGGHSLADPAIDRDDRDLRWTEEDPSAHQTPDLSVALVIDVSGSMAGAKLREACDACCGFIDVLEEAGVGERLGLVSFGSRGNLIAPLGSRPDLLRSAAQRLATNGSTNLTDGLEVGWSALARGSGRRVLVVLTDGSPDDRVSALDRRGDIVRADGEVIARGVTGADEDFLRRLDSGSKLLGEGELVASFRGIAQQLAGGRGSLSRPAR
jgi:molecular chaperone DnaK